MLKPVAWSAVTTPQSSGLRVRTGSFGDTGSSQEAGSRKYMLGTLEAPAVPSQGLNTSENHMLERLLLEPLP